MGRIIIALMLVFNSLTVMSCQAMARVSDSVCHDDQSSCCCGSSSAKACDCELKSDLPAAQDNYVFSFAVQADNGLCLAVDQIERYPDIAWLNVHQDNNLEAKLNNLKFTRCFVSKKDFV